MRFPARRARFWRAVAALAWLAITGCSAKKEAGPKEPPHLDGTPHTDHAVESWKDADLKPEAFAFVDPAQHGAGYCAQGRVSGLEVLVCEYADDGSLDRGKKVIEGLWEKQGAQTFVSLRNKRTLVVAADRAGADPNGKTASKLLAAFKKL